MIRISLEFELCCENEFKAGWSHAVLKSKDHQMVDAIMKSYKHSVD